eukprot:gene4555-20810_t
MAVTKTRAIAILINVAVFLLMIVFSQLSTKSSGLFPKTQREIAALYKSELTPAGSTFAIWGFIYIYQAAWIVYTLTLYWRGDGNILPTWFYMAYSIGNISSVCWLIVWSRGHISLAFVILLMHAISLDLCLYLAFKGMENYMSEFPNNEKLPNKVDVWCVRFLVLNGIMTYASWVSIATCLNLCIALTTDMNVGMSQAAMGVLALLLLIILVWFAMENYFFERYTRFVFIEYIVLIVGLSGIVKRHWTDGSGSQSFALALLALSGCLLIARVAVIILKERKTVNNGSNLKYIVRRPGPK